MVTMPYFVSDREWAVMGKVWIGALGLDAGERTREMTRFKFYVVANEKRDDENKVVRASKVLYPARGYDEYDAQIKKSNADLLDEPELRKVRDENGALKVSDVTVVYPFRQG